MINVQHLTKRFGDFAALDDVTCSIPEGCIYGMVGSNGAGKSTFLRVITGVYRPNSGTVTIDGEPIYENTAKKSEIAYVPDTLFFLNGASMERMAALYAASYPTFDPHRFEQLTAAFELNPKLSINNFSKGMKRQAATILALSCRPRYIFFDETFDGLDPIMRSRVKNLICEDVLERRSTAIITSHSLRELEDTCDQLALLHKGGLIMESDVQNLRTSLFKIQIAFAQGLDDHDFSDIEILHFVKHGSVANMIVRGDREHTIAKLQSLCPILLDVLPLSLEEVFTYEMEALGYTAENIWEG